jgi:hypothetical protein
MIPMQSSLPEKTIKSSRKRSISATSPLSPIANMTIQMCFFMDLFERTRGSCGALRPRALPSRASPSGSFSSFPHPRGGPSTDRTVHRYYKSAFLSMCHPRRLPVFRISESFLPRHSVHTNSDRIPEHLLPAFLPYVQEPLALRSAKHPCEHRAELIC